MLGNQRIIIDKMIQLNTELKDIMEVLGKSLPSVIVEDNLDDNNVLHVFIKTPNIFYKETKVFINESDITGELSDKQKNSIEALMSQAYFNYFTHYNEQFKSKYYRISYIMEDGKLIPTALNRADKVS